MSQFLTVTEAAREIESKHGFHVPVWKFRRVVDAMKIDMPRAALYRLIDRRHLPAIVQELERQGWPSKRHVAVAAEAVA